VNRLFHSKHLVVPAGSGCRAALEHESRRYFIYVTRTTVALAMVMTSMMAMMAVMVVVMMVTLVVVAFCACASLTVSCLT